MDKSISTSSQNTTITNSSQESSWTKYLDYFMASQEKIKGQDQAASSYNSYSLSSDDVAGNSTVFDVVSCAGEKASVGFNTEKKRKRGLLDEDLEDTASSPNNSPKVSDLIQFKLNSPNQFSQAKRDYINTASKENGIIHAKEEMTTLKKRGLCLVPLSMILEKYR